MPTITYTEPIVWDAWSDFWKWSISVGISTLADGFWAVLEGELL